MATLKIRNEITGEMEEVLCLKGEKGEKGDPGQNATDEQVANAVEQYLTDNPIIGGIQEETDPTVPAWAKQPTKPSYTADEVGALPKNWKALRYCGTFSSDPSSDNNLPPTEGREVGDVFIADSYDRECTAGHVAVMWDGEKFVPIHPPKTASMDVLTYDSYTEDATVPTVEAVRAFVIDEIVAWFDSQVSIEEVLAAIDSAIADYDTEAMALLGEDGEIE